MERGYRDPALLRCERKPSCGDMIEHRFTGQRPCFIDNNVGAFKELYSCSVCGKLRQWGLNAMKDKAK